MQLSLYMKKNKQQSPRPTLQAQTSLSKPTVPAPKTASPFDPRLRWLFHGLLIGAALLLTRYHFLDVPLERDESAYAYMGKLALEGGAPYRDFYEMKPPLIFYAYAVLVKVFGFSFVGLRWAAMVLGLATSTRA